MASSVESFQEKAHTDFQNGFYDSKGKETCQDDEMLEVRRIAKKMFALFNLTTFCVSFGSDVSTPLFYLHLREREPSGVGVLSRGRKWEKIVMIGDVKKPILATDPFISNSYCL